MDYTSILPEEWDITGAEKFQSVAALVYKLELDLERPYLQLQERNASIEQLKVFARDNHNAEPLYTDNSIVMLAHHSFDKPSSTTSRIALQCLANVLMSGGAHVQNIFRELGCPAQAVTRLKNPEKDDEFLMSRILSLSSCTDQDKTPNVQNYFADLIEKYNLAKYINENIARHAKNHSKLSKKASMYREQSAMSETMKLLLTITKLCEHHTGYFRKSISPIIKIISLKTVSPVTIKTMNYLTNALVHLDFAKGEHFTSKSELKLAIEKLVQIIDQSMRSETTVGELENAIIPASEVLRKISAASRPDIRALIKQNLLPSAHHPEELDLGFCQDLLPYRLQQQLRRPVSSKISQSIKDLLCEITNQNQAAFDMTMGLRSHQGCEPARHSQSASLPPLESEKFNWNDSRTESRASAQSEPTLSRKASMPAFADVPQARPVRPTLLRAKSDSENAILQATAHLRELLSSKGCGERIHQQVESFHGVTLALSFSPRPNAFMDEEILALCSGSRASDQTILAW